MSPLWLKYDSLCLYMCVKSFISGGLICWPGQKRFTVTCTNRLVPTDTLIIAHTHTLSCAWSRAALLRHEVLTQSQTNTHTPLCLVSNNSLQWGLKMLGLLQHQSQQSTFPSSSSLRQHRVYTTTTITETPHLCSTDPGWSRKRKLFWKEKLKIICDL